MPNNPQHELESEVIVKFPTRYKVFILNDDYTSMEFVVDILMKTFNKSYEEAEAIMLSVHKEGMGLCGIYTHEIAETKVHRVDVEAKEAGFPLKATMEEE